MFDVVSAMKRCCRFIGCVVTEDLKLLNKWRKILKTGATVYQRVKKSSEFRCGPLFKEVGAV